MKSAEGKRFVYEKNQLIEVICQLRFPTILAIDSKEPVDFQETVRDNFPRYQCQMEQVPGPDGKAMGIHNHSFISEDGTRKLSLTRNFIALSTMRYTSWEDFAGALDEPLGQLIRIYRPAFFERVGLRYVNGFSRERLSLEGRRWNDLIQSAYLGVLDDDEEQEDRVVKCSLDLEMRLDQPAEGVPGAGVKVHAGPGTIKRTVRTPEGAVKTLQEPSPRFIFDQDLYSIGKVQLPEVMTTLERLHEHADRLFSDAITDVLHDAMEAIEI